MSAKWERTFEIAVPIEDVWHAFTDPEYRAKLMAPPTVLRGDRPPQRPEEGMEILEAEPLKRLRWSVDREGQPEKSEFSVVFESKEGGSRLTVTRYGFGEGEDADIFSKSNGLGWEHGMMDLVLALETGQLVKRHYDGCVQSAAGIEYDERDWGLEVMAVGDVGLGEEAGLRRGDRLVRIGGVSVYQRRDMWVLNDVHPPGTELDVEYIRGRELRTGRGRLTTASNRMVGE